MKALKQRFTQWYNGREGRDGFLWSERFKSVLVEDGHAARVMAAYIDLNPVRAGIVATAGGLPVERLGRGGGRQAQGARGLEVADGREIARPDGRREAAHEAGDWRKTAAAYRRMMEDDVARRGGPQPAGGKREGGRDGGAGKLSEAELLRGRVRYFTDGLVVGSEQFVDAAFGATKELFGPKRKSGARKLTGADTGLRVMRALRVKPRGA